MMPQIFWITLGAALSAWLGMNLWSAPKIEELAGGLRLLDMRFTGYSFDDVQDFLAAIGDEGTALYLGPQFWLDMIFPPLLGALLFIIYRWLFPALSGLAICAASVTYVATDFLENLAIAALLRAGADGVTHEMIAMAHRWTIAKWSLSVFGVVLLVVGIALRLRRRWLTS